MSHAAYPDAGEMIGPYRVGRRLGHGGMGIVYEALDVQLNRQVALKVISPHLADDETFRARFTQEAQAQARLDSGHVVAVYAHGEADGRLYIASQLIPGGDLGQMLGGSGVPPLSIGLELIAQVAEGLSDAHDAELVHRDIKPANVLLRIRGQQVQAYLADFGISRRVDAVSGLTTAGSTVGTPTYMAPELHTGGQPGVASDIYSLGCLLWVTLTGRAPYTGASDYEIVRGHLEEPVPQVAERSPAEAVINRVLRGTLAKQPGERYPSAALVAADLQRAVDLLSTGTGSSVVAPAGGQGGPPSSYPTGGTGAGGTGAGGAGTGAAPRSSKAPMIVGLVALLALTAGGVGVGIALSGDSSDSEADGDPGNVTSSSSSESASGSESPTGSTSAAPTGLPTVVPTDASDIPTDLLSLLTGAPQTGYTLRTAREREAFANLVPRLEDQLTTAQASCVAGRLIDDIGLDTMIEVGLITKDLEYSDTQVSGMPADVQQKFTSISFACARA